jgi:hypothetical protein
VSLALVAAAWSRTYRSRAVTFAGTDAAQLSRNGIRIVPDRVTASWPAKTASAADRKPETGKGIGRNSSRYRGPLPRPHGRLCCHAARIPKGNAITRLLIGEGQVRGSNRMKRLDEAMHCARAQVAARSRMTKAVASVAASALAKNKSAEELLRRAVNRWEFTRQRDPLFRRSPIEVNGGGVAATDDDADAFSGPRLVGTGGQCRECCCATRLRDDTQRAPEC